MRHQRRILTFVIVLLVASSLMPARWAQKVSDGPRDAMVAVLAPMSWLRAIGNAIRGRDDLQINAASNELLMRDRAEALRQIEELRARLEHANRRIEQLSRIRRQVGLQGVSLQPATVVEWTVSRVGPMMTIDRGRRLGVGDGMVVAQGVHLIGRVVHVGADSATVQPVTTPSTHLAVSIKPPRPTDPDFKPALLQIKAQNNGTFTARADAGDRIKVGDVAHLYDRTWPLEAQGFVIGNVVEITADEEDPILRRKVVVVPVRSVARVSEVVVAVPNRVSPAEAQ